MRPRVEHSDLWDDIRDAIRSAAEGYYQQTNLDDAADAILGLLGERGLIATFDEDGNQYPMELR